MICLIPVRHAKDNRVERGYRDLRTTGRDYHSELDEMVELTYLFASQKVPGIVQKHFLHSWVKNDTRHGAFVPGVRPSP